MDSESQIFYKTIDQIKEESDMAKRKETSEPIVVHLTEEDKKNIVAQTPVFQLSDDTHLEFRGFAKSDSVDHPQHYHPGTYEAINVIEAWDLGFCLGNAVKYISRAGHKGDAVEDLRKAVWYLNREIENRITVRVDE